MADDAATPARPWWQRVPLAVGIVLMVYACVIVLADPNGTLGTDTGAKVATIDRMVETGSVIPDVGYWAADVDPDGTYHPLFDTHPTDDGAWINVTTLPMVEAARPLYAIGGYRLALLFPIGGALLAAFAGRSLAVELVDDEDDADPHAVGMLAFWVIAVASPIAVYALDFWEHSLGAGLMVVGVAAALRVADGRAWPLPAAVAGGAFGAAATMRTEALVVGAVAVGVACVFRVRRSPGQAVGAGALALTTLAVPWLANTALESAVSGNSRLSRTGSQASGDLTDELGERAREALTTWFGLPLGSSWQVGVVLGVGVVLAIAGVIVLARKGESRSVRIVAALAMCLYLAVALDGFGFVPGALVASPVAVAAGFLPLTSQPRVFLLGTALLTTPLIWFFQLTGGAEPQWGGRYLLAPTVVLTVLGVVVLGQEPVIARRLIVGLAAAVTLVGAGWLVVRTHGVDATFEDLVAIDDDVLISTNGFFLREGGAAVIDKSWLSVGRRGTLPGAFAVAEASGATTVGVLSFSESPPRTDESFPAGMEFVETVIYDFLDVPLYHHRFVLA